MFLQSTEVLDGIEAMSMRVIPGSSKKKNIVAVLSLLGLLLWCSILEEPRIRRASTIDFPAKFETDAVQVSSSPDRIQLLSTQLNPAKKARIVSAYGSLPMSLEANKGQLDIDKCLTYQKSDEPYA